MSARFATYIQTRSTKPSNGVQVKQLLAVGLVGLVIASLLPKQNRSSKIQGCQLQLNLRLTPSALDRVPSSLSRILPATPSRRFLASISALGSYEDNFVADSLNSWNLRRFSKTCSDFSYGTLTVHQAPVLSDLCFSSLASCQLFSLFF